MASTTEIIRIEDFYYEGFVYNIELKSSSAEDDLFWIEQETKIISHNCFPKDLLAMIDRAKELDIEPTIMQAAWIKNEQIRKQKDWLKINGATS